MRIARFFFSNWRNWLGLLLVLTYVGIALAAPSLSPMDEKAPGPLKRVGRVTDYKPHPPSTKSPLGTAPQQYDIFHTLVWGTRDALQFGLIVVVTSMIFGVAFGAVAGSAGGLLNSVMMRISDAFLSFPILAGVVFLQQLVAVTLETLTTDISFQAWLAGKMPVTGSTPLTEFFSAVDPIVVGLILFSWMSYARLTNTRVITLKQNEFIIASRALGASSFWITWKHLIPNAIAPSLVLASRDMGNVVILQATFTFLHLGGDSPWGRMLSLGRDWVIGPGGSVFSYWWIYIPITLAVVLFGISWNLLGDGINESMNPSSTRVTLESK